ncbi:MAG: 30S ribosomal protein S4 [Clostridia bacterium]|nr:30S ribosomal protein S4 [Clostridia bacterium]
MAKYTDAKCRQCRREGCKLFLKGERCTSGKCAIDRRPVVPGQHGAARKKVSEYGLQLREKQKVRRAYGVLERQFANYYEKATRSKQTTGLALLQQLELRLDNVAYRMGIGSSRAEARQRVGQNHLTVNGKKVNIPSYQVKVGDVIAVKESSQALEMFKALKELKIVMPKWLEFNTETLTGKILALPERDDIDLNIKENLIVEFYSR